MDFISGLFTGYPYSTCALIGSQEKPEVFTMSFDAFDCVTYIETVLALARADSVATFVTNLRRIRYRGGDVGWLLRNHYMTEWIRNNVRDGWVRQLKLSSRARLKERVLDAVPGLPARKRRFSCTPKPLLLRESARLNSGDIIFFASTRADLDVFHCGILVRENSTLLLRHASRSQGGVVQHPLSEFLDGNRMAGVMVVRPNDGFPV